MNEDTKSRETNPDSEQGVLAEVEIYLAYQMAEQAIAVLEEALADGSGGPEHLVRLIEIYASQRNMDAAREHARVALGQFGPEDEALRSRILAVDPEWSRLQPVQPVAAEAGDSGAAALALVDQPEPPESGGTDSTPEENRFTDEAPAVEGPIADQVSETPTAASDPPSLRDQASHRSWRLPLIAFGVLAGLAAVFVFMMQRSPIQAPPSAALPEPSIQGENIPGEPVSGAPGRAGADGPAATAPPEFGTAAQMAGQVYFRGNNTEVEPRFEGLLDGIADRLVSSAGSFAEIVGYPSRDTEPELGEAFARHSARAVANQLIRRGVAPESMRVQARTGEDLVLDGWAIDDHDGLVVIHLGGPAIESIQ